MTPQQKSNVLSSLNLAKHEARQVARQHRVQNEEDWYSHALELLCNASISFDADKCDFRNWAKFVIRRGFVDWLRVNGPYKRNKTGPNKENLKIIYLSESIESVSLNTPEEILSAVQELNIIDNQILEIF
jgi:hypothetical protein